MKITRTSTMSGIIRTMEIDVTKEQMDAWENGELIQRAMPGLTASEREFIMTGATDEEWDAMFDLSDDEADGEA
jgi:hypothetical protein